MDKHLPPSPNAGDFYIHRGILVNYGGPGGHVVIPEGVERLVGMAFSSRSWLPHGPVTSVTLPSSLKSLGDAFAYCDTLTRIEIPGSVGFIPTHAFQECTALEEVVIGEGVKSIGDGSFAGCRNLRSVLLPDSLRRIYPTAFHRCPSLRILYLPAKCRITETPEPYTLFPYSSIQILPKDTARL